MALAPPFTYNEYFDFDFGDDYDRIPIYSKWGAIDAPRQVLEFHFPLLRTQIQLANFLDIESLAWQTDDALQTPEINPHTFKVVLYKLFRSVRKETIGHHRPSPSIYRMLAGPLEGEISRRARSRRRGMGMGLSKSHTSFLILATFSRITLSRTLAAALAGFWLANHRKIMANERLCFIQKWVCGLMELESLVMPMDFNRCMRPLSRMYGKIFSAYRNSGVYDPKLELALELLALLAQHAAEPEYGRGRGDRYLLPGPFHAPRSRTVPPRQLPHWPPNMMISAPQPSPTPSFPEHALGPYMGAPIGDQVAELGWRQDMLEVEVDSLKLQLGAG